MANRFTRRSFLQSAAAAGTAVMILPSRMVHGYAANSAVDVACIGVGGQGTVNRKWLQNDGANIVALCDVDEGRIDAAMGDHPGAKRWVDYLQMLQEQRNIDGVMVSTPDHTHFPASVMAIKMGKGVCTEKPLTRTIWEARELGLLARKHKVATQLDQEGHAGEGLRKGVEWVQSGLLGDVREVHIFTDRPIWPQGIAQHPETKPVPKKLHWDLWIGSSPYRDYHEHLHPFQWRGWWDFGCGALGDMGCHFFDLSFWALKLGCPKTVEAVSEGNSRETFPNWSTVTYEFPARGDLPPVTLKWYDGLKAPKTPGEPKEPNLPERPAMLEAGRTFPRNGSMLVGSKNTMLVNDTGGIRLIPESRMKDLQQPKSFIPRSPGHKKEWLAAIQGGPPASSNFTGYGGPLAECVLMGNLAIKAGKKIEWDGEKLKAVNAPELDAFIHPEYRKGWEF